MRVAVLVVACLRGQSIGCIVASTAFTRVAGSPARAHPYIVGHNERMYTRIWFFAGASRSSILLSARGAMSSSMGGRVCELGRVVLETGWCLCCIPYSNHIAAVCIAAAVVF